MKLAFSTLGCPGWSWDEIFATAKDLGMDGIEIRGIENEMYAPRATPFLHLEETTNRLKKSNLEISMLTSGACLSNDANSEEMINEAKEYIDLAEKIGCKYIRVFCSTKPYPEENTDLETCKKNYQIVCDYAKTKGVYPLIETNGLLANSKTLASFIKYVDRENAFVLWDIHHPFRFFNESPEQTLINLDGFVKYVHVKDSIMSEGKVIYKMMGHGDIPLLDTLKQLKINNYDGFISLEWVKRWCPDLEEPGIVFSHYYHFMKNLLSQI